MPEILPFKRALVLISGLVEVIAGFAFFFPQARQTAGTVLILLLIAVFPANINMAAKNIDFGFIPHWLLWLRLPLQLLLIWLVWVLAKQGQSSEDNAAD
jgi:uncharacterized membrane protein